MKLAVAQIKPAIGPVEKNLERHLFWTQAAASHNVDFVVFPELSLTGYEPAQANAWSRTLTDSCFDVLQKASDKNQIAIGAGAPLHIDNKLHISMLLFQPEMERQVYTKTYLHQDEKPFFAPGPELNLSISVDPAIALAICYELSVPEHAEKAARRGAEVYIASVAKTSGGVEKASRRLAQVACNHSMMVLMSNCLGEMDGMVCAGGSGAWDRKGNLLGRLDDKCEGLVILDTKTGSVITMLNRQPASFD